MRSPHASAYRRAFVASLLPSPMVLAAKRPGEAHADTASWPPDICDQIEKCGPRVSTGANTRAANLPKTRTIPHKYIASTQATSLLSPHQPNHTFLSTKTNGISLHIRDILFLKHQPLDIIPILYLRFGLIQQFPHHNGDFRYLL